MPTRVGKLHVLQLTVYARADGTYFFNDAGERVSVHGNQKWTTEPSHFLGANVQMRGARRLDDPPRRTAGNRFDEDMRRAIAASMEDSGTIMPSAGHGEADDLAAAIVASLQDAPASVTPSDPPTEAGNTANTCSICMDDIGSGARALRCGALF